MKKIVYTEQDRELAIQQLHDYYQEHGKLPQQREYTKRNGFSYAKHAAWKMFGSWADYVVAAGFERPVIGKTHYAHLISNLRKAIFTEHTTDRDVLRKRHPNLVQDRSVYEGRFGSWKETVEKAISTSEYILLKRYPEYSIEDAPIPFLSAKFDTTSQRAQRFLARVKEYCSSNNFNGMVSASRLAGHIRFNIMKELFGSPSNAVILAGYEPVGKNRKPEYRAVDGHMVDSLLELDVDNWLYANGYDHDVQPAYPGHGRMRADFVVNGIYLEVAGFSSSSNGRFRKTYLQKMERKVKKAIKHNLPLIIFSDFSPQTQTIIKAALDGDVQLQTPRIAGNSLEPLRHSIAGNGKCDGLKSERIGQSAAEPFSDTTKGKVQRPCTVHPATDEDMVRPYGKPQEMAGIQTSHPVQ